MRVVTLNLNGIRAAYHKGLGAWLHTTQPDIACWQEVRADDSVLTEDMRHPAGLSSTFVLPQKRGYSGVALLSQKKPDMIHRTFGGGVLDTEGRFVRFDFPTFSVVSLYLPSGSSGEERQQVKYDVMNDFFVWLETCRRETEKSGRDFLICGDINIAHTEKDIKNWRGNRKNSGFLPEERAWLSHVFDELGWVDVFRQINNEDGQYTWWSNRGRAWDNNVGWRIDYQIATPRLAARARQATIYKAQRFSDHAPLIIDYD
ncbi:exodeoxyribonuclease III [Candidatus Persebacteraceae bacterium Df01]|jgi:exodeoxyribonuclease-3|uniref:Exodeoxyribonuclease III n=1 Tax=Candidatus Doriopsillibacter californiensis TaxID=2970740 RepID=A0ABT7QLE4_9GAMM|nr:exodeoxyribonuclease III [Candidatus Persebacteraceae bacterium Df01]